MTPGDICLLPFPFHEGAEQQFKRRPVLILGATPHRAAGDDAVLVAMITTNPRRFSSPGPGDVPIPDWAPCGLLGASTVRTRRLWTAERSDIIRRVGAVQPEVLAEVVRLVDELWPRPAAPAR